MENKNTMLMVYLLIGLPGAGKTTFAKTLNDAQIVSVDEVRQQLSDNGIIGKTYSSADNKIVFEHFHNKILEVVKNGAKHVVVDSTNARLNERQDIFNLLSDFKPKFVAVRFIDSAKTCLKRILKREKLENGVHHFENPTEALKIYENRIKECEPSLLEQFAEIWYVKNGKVKSKTQKLLIASTNLGKINIYKDVCSEIGVLTTSLAEIKVDITVEETGSNELENAILKAQAYFNETSLPVLSNDSGLVIDKFSPDDQPGVMVRRFGGRELTDQEMLEIYINKLNEVGGSSTGHYNVALVLINGKGKIKHGEFKPKRYFINKPSKVLNKGVPLSSLSFDEKTGKYLSEMTIKERNTYEADAMIAQKNFIKNNFKN